MIGYQYNMMSKYFTFTLLKSSYNFYIHQIKELCDVSILCMGENLINYLAFSYLTEIAKEFSNIYNEEEIQIAKGFQLKAFNSTLRSYMVTSIL